MQDTGVFVRAAALERVFRLGGLALVDRLIETGLHNLDQRLRELQSATAAGDRERAHRAAHSVRGSSLYLGLEELAARADAVETAAARGEPGWPEAAAALEPTLLEAVRGALLAARDELAAGH